MEVKEKLQDNGRILMYCDYGKCILTLSEDKERLSVANIFVSPKAIRNGIAQTLLSHVIILAIQQGLAVTAAITSRESLSAFKHVFGEESLDLRRIGLYESDITDASGIEQ